MGMHKNKELSSAEIDQISLMMGEINSLPFGTSPWLAKNCSSS
jgi:hypothetical protein